MIELKKLDLDPLTEAHEKIVAGPEDFETFNKTASSLHFKTPKEESDSFANIG
jgi:hypothetical protein